MHLKARSMADLHLKSHFRPYFSLIHLLSLNLCKATHHRRERRRRCLRSLASTTEDVFVKEWWRRRPSSYPPLVLDPPSDGLDFLPLTLQFLTLPFLMIW
ncbi:unnamed protein product [Lactuca virosa]|uniref:Uncharacterized protein n=1 Tax=Lactuca virosa TaxID=75947 RepID=A0AAU9MF87_9ASTR|nr:unnamed protein product [Lactuca virosa]